MNLICFRDAYGGSLCLVPEETLVPSLNQILFLKYSRAKRILTPSPLRTTSSQTSTQNLIEITVTALEQQLLDHVLISKASSARNPDIYAATAGKDVSCTVIDHSFLPYQTEGGPIRCRSFRLQLLWSAPIALWRRSMRCHRLSALHNSRTARDCRL